MLQLINRSLFIISPIILILGMCFYYSYLKLKKSEYKKLELISIEISQESKIEKQLIKSASKPQVLEKNTQNKLQKIKVGIFNMDFTLSEIF